MGQPFWRTVWWFHTKLNTLLPHDPAIVHLGIYLKELYVDFCNSCIHNFHNERHKDCPIIGEIPDKHGRLIDVDKLIASFRKWADAPIKRTNNEIADFLEEYSKDSTIVEATE